MRLLRDNDQTASRFRPRRRRAAMTLRPPTVLMRLRKPCVFALLRRFGWYVRFMKLLYYRHLRNPREYIRSPRSHPALQGKARPPPTHPPARVRWMGKRCKTSTNCDKLRMLGAEDPLSGGVDQAFRRLGRLAFQAVIHRLWISLWITTLMSCKTTICFQTL